MDVGEPRSPGPAPAAAPEPYGFWATWGLGAAMAVAFVIVQGAVLMAIVLISSVSDPTTNVQFALENAETNGLVVGAAATASAIFGIFLVTVLVAARGVPIKEYLALKRVEPRVVLLWIGITAVFVVCADLLTVAVGRSVVPDFVRKTYDTAGFLPLYLFGIALAAPLFEEVFFRGFLFQGTLRSKAGPWGAVLLTSLVFTVVHVQYGLFELAQAFAMGLLMGTARLKTGSLYVSVSIHVMINTIAAAEAAFL